MKIELNEPAGCALIVLIIATAIVLIKLFAP